MCDTTPYKRISNFCKSLFFKWIYFYTIFSTSFCMLHGLFFHLWRITIKNLSGRAGGRAAVFALQHVYFSWSRTKHFLRKTGFFLTLYCWCVFMALWWGPEKYDLWAGTSAEIVQWINSTFPIMFNCFLFPLYYSTQKNCLLSGQRGIKLSVVKGQHWIKQGQQRWMPGTYCMYYI